MAKVLMFDTWGTLVDNYSIADVIEPYVGESHVAQKIAQDWRFQQKWAMFYLTLSDSFVPHPPLNEACLKWALDRAVGGGRQGDQCTIPSLARISGCHQRPQVPQGAGAGSEDHRESDEEDDRGPQQVRRDVRASGRDHQLG